MEHFCTLFDIGFLPQGQALHASLQRHARPFVLWVLCLDQAVEEALKRLELEDIRLISLSSIETSALWAVKSGRSRAEYCWTLTPFLPSAVMELEPLAQRVTYVDADCWFLNDPRLILEEMDRAQKDVLITPHGYLTEHDRSRTNGNFCVQFVPFRKTAAGLAVLSWWQERCLEWCFDRNDDGRFGDQKYLDQWPELFPHAVHILGKTSLTLAPWNARRYQDDQDLGRAACMYHFHNLRIFQGWLVCFCLGWDYYLPDNILKVFYQPYLKDLGQAKHRTLKAGIKCPFPSADKEWNIFIRLKDTLFRLFKNKGRVWRRVW